MNAETTVAQPAENLSKPAEMTRSEWTYRPMVDITETSEELMLWVDLPGASGDAIDVDFRDGTLSIHAKVLVRQPEKTNYLLREYGVGDFHRSFSVGEAVDASKITAEYRDGVLTLHLPKASSAMPHKIAVKSQ